MNPSLKEDVYLAAKLSREYIKLTPGHCAYSCNFSPDNLKIAYGSSDGYVIILDSITGECVKILVGHDNNYVFSCGYSPDGTRIVSSSADYSIKIWNVDAWQCVETLNDHSSWVRRAKFSADGAKIISCSDDKTIIIRCATTYEHIKTLTGDKAVISCDISQDGSKIIYSSNYSFRIQNITKADSKIIDISNGVSYSARFSPNGNLAIFCDGDTVRAVNSTSGDTLKIFSGHLQSVICCNFSSDGTKIVSGSEDTSVKIWDVATKKCIRTLNGHTEAVVSCAFSPDGSQIVSSSLDESIIIWNFPLGIF